MSSFWLILIGVLVVCFILQRTAAMMERSTAEKQARGETTTANPLRPIDREEETTLRNCFPWTVYYLQNLEYRPQAVICRGQLRTNPEAAYQRIRENVEARFGDRFLVVFQEGLSGKPFFALVPNPQRRREIRRYLETATRPWLALSLLVVSFITCAIAGARISGTLVPAVKGVEPPPFDVGVLMTGVPYAVALLAILGLYEVAHYLVARFYKVRATLPYFVPVPFVPGTVGAFIQIRTPVPHRRALFDLGISGPLVGFLITLPVLIWGLTQSDAVPAPTQTERLNFNAIDPRISLLLSLLSKLALGNQLTTETVLDLHPLAIAGCVGLAIVALKLMPIGQLDGGHIVHAMFGQRAGIAIGQVARLIILALCLIQPYLLIWAIVLILFVPVGDEPALNDVSELDNWRDCLGLISLAVLLAIILPTPAPILSLLSL